MPWEVGIDLSDGDRSVLAVAALALGATTVVLLFAAGGSAAAAGRRPRAASATKVPHQLDGELISRPWRRRRRGRRLRGTELEQIEMIDSPVGSWAPPGPPPSGGRTVGSRD